ncbi:cyrochrome P450 monooxygenase asqL [Colletotrichum spaethianum]|uniref:Cyrochrome P450 monooxygenase asqL n=1 Tax=Colletotrichum spaethianum TaxID=700344 RepID=A0AA37L710_9PEZI|nr:cyrochrome P450 monooxygenase asqL [Colletotrichum spaethianum]GKT43048.1 cyrochrome P450 monooxygenase asqL [Colletotrichum spaethianum]
MSPHTVHTNVGVWGPTARSFNPDRWLVPNAKTLEQYHVPFSKGYRMCIGQNLATAKGITIFHETWLEKPTLMKRYLELDDVEEIDYILISHAHFDQ